MKQNPSHRKFFCPRARRDAGDAISLLFVFAVSWSYASKGGRRTLQSRGALFARDDVSGAVAEYEAALG
jgi:hypothetical protein